jgi:tripartite-type tricarboxylate transporter receptor subunit TctC
MKLPHRRQFLHLAAGAAVLPAVSRTARAQAYPSQPIRLIIGYAPGGSTDITARVIAQWLSERLGQQVIVESKPGGGTNIAVQSVVNSPADGYTLLFYTASNAINISFYEALPFNLLRDIAPIAGLVSMPNIMEVNQAVPPKTVAEFIAYAKANPGKVNMATYGTGTTGHLAGELLKMMTGINLSTYLIVARLRP